jgi:hypothetical protein
MPSTIDTRLRPVIRSTGDTFTELLEGASEMTCASLEAYATGVNAMIEQQTLLQEASQQWFSSLMSGESDAAQQLVEGLTRAGEQIVETTAASAKVAAHAGATVATPSRGGVVPPGKEGSPAAPAPKRRRRATTQASKSALASALRSGPAKWTSEGYEALTAAEIIARLPQLSQGELGDVEAYEKAHQSRSTVLQRVASLRTPEPMPGYDELTVPEIQERIAQGDSELAARVREYESPRKGRDGVLQAAGALLGSS